MAEITHRRIQTNGMELFIAEAGEGPLVVLSHGWPECWYSWRHQLSALADAGFHAVAPDQRGYGRSTCPPEIDDYTVFHLVGDLVGLVEVMGQAEATLVGHDWGSIITWTAAQLRPDMFTRIVSLSVPTLPRRAMRPMDTYRQVFGDRFFYQLYFQTPGVAEHEFQNDVRATVRKMLYGASGINERTGMFDITNSPPASNFMLQTMDDPGEDIGAWATPGDVDYFVESFEISGFRGGLNWYRNLDRNWDLMAAMSGRKIEQPTMFITGDRDVVPWNDEFETGMRSMVPGLEEVHVLPGIGHWTQQEAADDVNCLLGDFLGSSSVGP